MPRTPEANKIYMKSYFEKHRHDPAFRARKLLATNKWRRANPQAYAQISYRYNVLKAKCKYRGYELGLSIEEYRLLVENKPCNYCGGSTVSFGSGLDRVDSTKGYTQGNCVPCCYLCNVMKSDMTLETFYEQCERIVDFRKR